MSKNLKLLVTVKAWPPVAKHNKNETEMKKNCTRQSFKPDAV